MGGSQVHVVKVFAEYKLIISLVLHNMLTNCVKKNSQKVNPLARILSLMRFEQRKNIAYLFITSHFSYCPFIWMLYSRRINN